MIPLIKRVLRTPFAFISILRIAFRPENELSEKISILVALLSLKFKKLIRSERNNSEYSVSFFDYFVSGFSLEALETLFCEVFLGRPYYFRSHTSAPVIIDCGANIGVSVLYFKKLFPVLLYMHLSLIRIRLSCCRKISFRIKLKTYSCTMWRWVIPPEKSLSSSKMILQPSMPLFERIWVARWK